MQEASGEVAPDTAAQVAFQRLVEQIQNPADFAASACFAKVFPIHTTNGEQVIQIDGSEGEGGGQILRSALSLSMCTQQAFRISNIRANRDKPGLMRQHLTAVNAAAEICGAHIEGAHVGSRELLFEPGPLTAGEFRFSIGTAGSSTLVLQTVLLPLLTAKAPSIVQITGGTHNRGSPPFDFLARAFIPLLKRIGAEIDLEILSYGFYPRGGGHIRAQIRPAALTSLQLHERGAQQQLLAEAYVAGLSMDIGERELRVIGRELNLPTEQLHLRALPNDMGPGNAVTITVQHENVTEVFTGFGERGVPAERVARSAARAAREYLEGTAPIGEHLADQLLLPLALAGSGSFTTAVLSEHLQSNALVIAKFTERRIDWQATSVGYRVCVK